MTMQASEHGQGSEASSCHPEGSHSAIFQDFKVILSVIAAIFDLELVPADTVASQHRLFVLVDVGCWRCDLGAVAISVLNQLPVHDIEGPREPLKLRVAIGSGCAGITGGHGELPALVKEQTLALIHAGDTLLLEAVVEAETARPLKFMSAERHCISDTVC